MLWTGLRSSVEMRNPKYLRHEPLETSALTGSGIDYTWRILLKLSELRWL